VGVGTGRALISGGWVVFGGELERSTHGLETRKKSLDAPWVDHRIPRRPLPALEERERRGRSLHSRLRKSLARLWKDGETSKAEVMDVPLKG